MKDVQHQRSSHNSYTEIQLHSNHKKVITDTGKDADQIRPLDTASENVI